MKKDELKPAKRTLTENFQGYNTGIVATSNYNTPEPLKQAARELALSIGAVTLLCLEENGLPMTATNLAKLRDTVLWLTR